MYCVKIIYHPCPYFFLDNSCKIGKGLFIQHGFSTIIMADIGNNCWINQQVTIGYKDKSGRPNIGDNVRISHSIIGPYASIGAGSVIESSILQNSIVQPSAKIINSNV